MEHVDDIVGGIRSGHRVRILLSNSGRGLRVDAELLRDALSAHGCEVELAVTRPWSVRRTVNSHRYARVKQFMSTRAADQLDRVQVMLQAFGKRRVDLQVHLESIAVDYLGAGRENWLIPNQEWVRTQHLGFLGYVDRVLCKTREAERIFRTLHPDVVFTGFSNPVAQALPVPLSDPLRMHRFLHVAGRNRKKGTAAIVGAWRRHPEWPRLHLVIDDPEAFGPLPENVTAWIRPDDNRLAYLHRRNGVVLAPSEVEGYGHVLIEGMAAQNLVVTTDAAPMNELVTPRRGRLVSWSRSEPCHLGTRYFVDAEAVERVVEALLQTPRAELAATALAARDWVIRNHAEFLDRLDAELSRPSRAARPDGIPAASFKQAPAP